MRVIVQQTLLTAALLAALPGILAAAVTYEISVNTSSVNGTPGNLEFQFNPGPNSQAATAQIVNFTTTGGKLTGSPAITGDVSGALPGTVTFMNDQAFNDYFQGFKYGTSFSYGLVLSGPAIDSPNGTATSGTRFCMSLEDSGGAPILSLSPEPISGCALIIDINLDGSTTVTYQSPVVTVILVSDAFQVRYAANLNIGDSFINLTNTGLQSAFDPVGNICVNAYVFDASEEMVSCCSCVVTPNGVKSLSAQRDLLGNTLTAATPTAISIKLVATASGGSSGGQTCDPSTLLDLAPGMLAWGTTLHQSGGSSAVAEAAFQKTRLSDEELNSLSATCGFIQANGSGFGICKSCRTGALGAAQK